MLEKSIQLGELEKLFAKQFSHQHIPNQKYQNDFGY